MAASIVLAVLACSLTSVLGAPTKRWSSTDPINSDLAWGACTDFGVDDPDPNLSCGYYDVPMDYFDSSPGKARLAVVKYQATVPNKKGTLFTNPGGPGGSGIEFLAGLGADLSASIEGEYDIVSWDPRGVGSYTFPGDVICFTAYTEQVAFWYNTVVSSINETISTKFTDPKELEEFYSRVSETDAKLDEFGKNCLASNAGPYLQHIGTTSTIRDLVALADKIVGPGNPIDYHGYSYGTVIGFHLLTLFPDRVGHIILDGVVHPFKWGSYEWYYDGFADAEEVLTAFANACAQGSPDKCSLAKMIQGQAAGSDIRLLITSTIDLALKLQKAGFTGLPAQSGDLRALLHSALYVPDEWPVIANEQAYPIIAAILTAGRAYGFTDPYILPEDFVPPPSSDFSDLPALPNPIAAIAGADGAVTNGVPLIRVFGAIVATTRDVSPTFGAIWGGSASTPKWPVRSVEALPTFNHKTLSNRILVIGNTLDPITPLRNAEYVTQLLGNDNAVLVEHQAVGHTTLAQYSTCTNKIVVDFLLDSKLPQQETKCTVDSYDVFLASISITRARTFGFKFWGNVKNVAKKAYPIANTYIMI